MNTAKPSARDIPCAGHRYRHLFMAMNLALSSSESVPVRRHLYLNDIVILTAPSFWIPSALSLQAVFGSFLGDFFFYSHAHVLSLAPTGEAVVISLCARRLFPKKKFCGRIGVFLVSRHHGDGLFPRQSLLITAPWNMRS